MPRKARERSASGVYHIMMRGINRQQIFLDNDDRDRFLFTIKQFKVQGRFEIYAYCLMGNHIHLLLKELSDTVGQVMKRICGSYVHWYNKKYSRVGHLFQARFRSEAVNDITYLMTVFRYIHHNPLKAGYTAAIEDYEWTSYHDYVRPWPYVADIGFMLQMFAHDKEEARRQIISFIGEKCEDSCLDMDGESPAGLQY